MERLHYDILVSYLHIPVSCHTYLLIYLAVSFSPSLARLAPNRLFKHFRVSSVSPVVYEEEEDDVVVVADVVLCYLSSPPPLIPLPSPSLSYS